MSEQNPTPMESTPNDSEVDPILLQRYLQQARDNQNLTMGIVGGAAGALIGAIAWAVIAAITHLNIGYVAIGVGFLTGYGVRYMGKGIDVQFGICGAILAAIGVALGNVLAVCVFFANQESIPFMDVIKGLTPSIMWEMLKASFGFMDVVFYAIALWAGYKYSIRVVSVDEVRNSAGRMLAR